MNSAMTLRAVWTARPPQRRPSIGFIIDALRCVV
jgi:hypothetical protein